MLEMDLNRRDPFGCKNEDTNAAFNPHRHNMLDDEWRLQDLLRRTKGVPSAIPIIVLSPLSIRSAGDSRQAPALLCERQHL